MPYVWPVTERNLSNETEAMDTRKLNLVKLEVKGFPDADLSFAAYPDGSTANGAMPTNEQVEFVKRWNAYPELLAALEAIVEGNTMKGKLRYSHAEVIQEHYRIARAAITKAQQP